MRSRMSRPFSAFFCKMLLTLAQCFLKAGLLKLSVLDDGNFIIGFSHKLRWLGSLSFLVLVHTWYVGSSYMVSFAVCMNSLVACDI